MNRFTWLIESYALYDQMGRGALYSFVVRAWLGQTYKRTRRAG